MTCNRCKMLAADLHAIGAAVAGVMVPDDGVERSPREATVFAINTLRAQLAAQTARAEEAEHGCEVLSVGDPYERLRDVREAGRVALRERDEARAKLAALRAAATSTCDAIMAMVGT